MKLPFSNNIVIEDSKLADYLLNINHNDGSIKAKFLMNRKFDKDSLRTTLVNQAKEEEVKTLKKSSFGKKYIIESEVRSPDNMKFILRSV